MMWSNINQCFVFFNGVFFFLRLFSLSWCQTWSCRYRWGVGGFFVLCQIDVAYRCINECFSYGVWFRNRKRWGIPPIILVFARSSVALYQTEVWAKNCFPHGDVEQELIIYLLFHFIFTRNDYNIISWTLFFQLYYQIEVALHC